MGTTTSSYFLGNSSSRQSQRQSNSTSSNRLRFSGRLNIFGRSDRNSGSNNNSSNHNRRNSENQDENNLGELNATHQNMSMTGEEGGGGTNQQNDVNGESTSTPSTGNAHTNTVSPNRPQSLFANIAGGAASFTSRLQQYSQSLNGSSPSRRNTSQNRGDIHNNGRSSSSFFFGNAQNSSNPRNRRSTTNHGQRNTNENSGGNGIANHNGIQASSSAPSTIRTAQGDAEVRSDGSSISAGSDEGQGATSGTTAPQNKTNSPILWCQIKAKTRQHDSTKVLRKQMWFEAKEGSVFKVGSDSSNDLKLEDDRCSSLNASLHGVSSDKQYVALRAESRMYQLIGMGVKRDSNVVPLDVGSVIKVGSVSLEVTAICKEEAESTYVRFGTEIESNARKQYRKFSTPRQSNSMDTNGDDNNMSNDTEIKSNQFNPIDVNGGDAMDVDEGNGLNTHSSMTSHESTQLGDQDQLAIGNGDSFNGKTAVGQVTSPTNHGNDSELDGSMHEDGSQFEDLDDEPTLGKEEHNHHCLEVDDAGEMCYICWGEPSEKDLRGDEDNPNPLIRNPCGKCVGSSRYVHLDCITKWISTSGYGHCSICNGMLPKNFSFPPPTIELKVVRHRRGQSWVGTRRFTLSFKSKNEIVIGKDHRADVRLPDRSVCNAHAKIIFNRDTREFVLQDHSSISGTFLQVAGELQLTPNDTQYFKIGRTILSVHVRDKKTSMIRSFVPKRVARALSR